MSCGRVVTEKRHLGYFDPPVGRFLLVRIMGFDETTKYIYGIANWLMAQGIKSVLHSSPMYDIDDVGNIAENTIVPGPNVLAKLHQAKRAVRDLYIAIFMEKKKSHPSSKRNNMST